MKKNNIFKKKKIRVHLQYPWKFPDSPYYKYLIENPPKNIIYSGISKGERVTYNIFKFKISQLLKNFVKDTPQRIGITIVNAHLTNLKENYDLIHCAHCLSKNKDKPWVADLEMGGSLLISGFKNNNWQKKVRKYLIAKNCKKILPWTKCVKKRILQDFPEIKNKLQVVYPAIPEEKIQRKKHKKITLIYVARAFHLKGGIFALEVMKQLKKNYDIRGIVISDVPKKIKEKYPEIEIYNLLPQIKVFDLMRESDIFLYPSQMDTFGFALLEAMSFGLPVIALKTPVTDSITEIINEGKTGFLIDYSNNKGYLTEINKEEEPLLNKLYKKCASLIENSTLRKKMSKNCIKEIKNGKFSIKERNKKLRKIYEEALK